MFIETILHYIISKQIDRLDDKARGAFWHYTIPVYYLSENITEGEIAEIKEYNQLIAGMN
jgi:hypothetical protein